MMQNMYSVRSLSGFPIMHYICNEVIRRVLLGGLSFFCQVFTKVYISVELHKGTTYRHLNRRHNEHTRDTTRSKYNVFDQGCILNTRMALTL